jgi:mannose-1-phosphate guanylyltransferase
MAAPMKMVLFCGGSGTRLWPMSRASRPKQFQPLVGELSLFQMMMRRLERGFGLENVFVSTGAIYHDLILEQAPALPPDNIITEPEMRDTLAAVGYAVTVLNHRFPGCTLATLWGADHVIRDDAEFILLLKIARDLAVERGWTVKIDVRPTYPSTALGYIEVGDVVARVAGHDVLAYKRQVEKPDEQTARRFIEEGTYVWNTGYIVWTAEKILGLYERYAPAAYEVLQKIACALGTPDERSVIDEQYARLPKQSIDYGIFEKMGGEGRVVIPADLGWRDIGAWDVLRDEVASSGGGDREGNVIQGWHLGVDTRRTLVYGSARKLIVTIGLEDYVVVDTPDALLVCPAARSQDVKKVVDSLKAEHSELL